MMLCRNWSRSRVSKNRDQPSNLRGVIPVLSINALRQENNSLYKKLLSDRNIADGQRDVLAHPEGFYGLASARAA
jgi:hypothetical protein